MGTGESGGLGERKALGWKRLLSLSPGVGRAALIELFRFCRLEWSALLEVAFIGAATPAARGGTVLGSSSGHARDLRWHILTH